MQRYQQFLPVLISDFEISEWPHPMHNHNHYELIYIKSGNGRHTINKQTFPYLKGNIFLLGPDDQHQFEIESPTRFIFLKFTDLYLNGYNIVQKQWIQDMEYLIKNKEARLSKFTLTATDQDLTDKIYDVIAASKRQILHNETVIYLQLLSLSAILKRNLPEITGTRELEHNIKSIEAIYTYIHTNIYNPELLRMSIMANRFNTSESYIGPFFKRNTGTTLKGYITGYRKKLILKRIESKSYSLKEIVSEFGLTDESHLNKILK